MPAKYVTVANDMVDLIAWRLKGTSKGITEEIYAANPDLSAYGPVLPEGLTIMIPDFSAPVKVSTTRLWS